MPEPLLQTKLYVPSLRPNLVPRPRLVERLNLGLHPGSKLTLVSAPAGFGKTMLVSDWVNQSHTAVAWFSIDDGDNDHIRFLTYLTAAIQTVKKDIGQGVMAALNTPQPPTTEALLTALINQISAVAEPSLTEGGPAPTDQPAPKFSLVLDDYHLITAQSINDALTFLIDHLPDSMHLIICTRSDPPLPLARLRGRGQLNEIRENDLRFTYEEAAQFVHAAMDLELAAEDLSKLNARTEGWIAGLQMAVVSMKSRRRVDDTPGSVSSFIAAFSGSNRHILDYLVEEVLNSQPADIRTFLLHTAILDRLTAPLVDSVLGIVDAEGKEDSDPYTTTSKQTLEYLERANLFIIPLDDERRWYRYHHLFADLLRNQLNKEFPDLRRQLHRRASDWFEREGFIPEAMHHAINSGDSNRAADLLESLVSSLLNESRPATLLNLLDLLPKDSVAGRPWLEIHSAWAYFLTWQFDKIEPLLESVESHLSSGSAGKQLDSSKVASRILVRLIGLRAFMAQWQGDLAAAADLSYQALQQMDTEDHQLRSVLEANLSDICLIRGDLAAARSHGQISYTSGKSSGNYYSALSAICRLAELDIVEGRLHQAARTFRQAVRQGLQWGGGRPMPGTGRAHVGLGQVLYEWNDLPGAETQLSLGLSMGEESGAQEIVVAACLLLARLSQAKGEAEAASLALEQAAAIAATEISVLPADRVSNWQARIALVQGNGKALTRWVQSLEISTDVPVDTDYRYEESYLTLVRVWISQGRLEEASGLLHLLLAAAESDGRIGRVIELLMLSALALQAGGDHSQAVVQLERALTLAEPEGYARTFLDEGLPLARLLYKAAELGIAPSYTGTLLAAFAVTGEAAPKPDSGFAPQLVEPLSKRELQVLELIADGLSNQEIAVRLVLSLNTVKGHTRRIYGKLGVNSRTQAVAKARALGLLQPG